MDIVSNEKGDSFARQGFGFTMMRQKPAFDIRLSPAKLTWKGEVAKVHAAEWRNLNSL